MAFVMESWPGRVAEIACNALWLECGDVCAGKWNVKFSHGSWQPAILFYPITSDHQSSFKSQSKNHNLLHFNNIFIVCYFNKLYMEFTFLHFYLFVFRRRRLFAFLPFPNRSLAHSLTQSVSRWKVHWDLRLNGWKCVFVVLLVGMFYLLLVDALFDGLLQM